MGVPPITLAEVERTGYPEADLRALGWAARDPNLQLAV